MTGPQIKPGSPEWLKAITPSKVPAILGASRFESPYRLWHRMAGNLPPEPPRDIFTIGHAFEHALAYLWKTENPGWRLSPGEVQIAGDRAALGFNALATLDRRASRGRARRVVEFKTARDLSQWGDEFTDEAPLDYYLQVQAQQLITGWTEYPAHLVVMGPFFRWHTYVIAHDRDVAAQILTRCRDWARSLDQGTPPDLDDTVQTYEAVRELHPDIDGTTVDLDTAEALELLASEQALKDAQARNRAAKSRTLAAMGNAQTAEAAGLKIATRYQHGDAVRFRPNRKALAALTERTAHHQTVEGA